MKIRVLEFLEINKNGLFLNVLTGKFRQHSVFVYGIS